MAWSSLRRNRLRSFLTIGAIALGIAVMVYLISLGLGLEQLTIGTVQKSSQLLSLSITTPNEQLIPLTAKSVASISKLANVQSVLPQLTISGQMSLGDKSTNATVIGADSLFLEGDDSNKLVVGHYFRGEDSGTMVVTTGFLSLFGLDTQRTPLVTFTLGLSPTDFPGAPQALAMNVSGVIQSDAVSVYVPRQFLEGAIGAGNLPNYTAMKVVVNTLNDIASVSQAVRALGYRVTSVVDTIGEIQQVFRWIQGVLVALGSVAISVASIGMFNTLTISLLERTKEIGIMKALGVRRADIRRLFMTEAFYMGLLGGLAGVLMALFFQQLTIFGFQLLAAFLQGTVPALFTNNPLILGGFLVFGILIAMVTGIYPAQRATRLNAIEAIKYE